MRQNRRFTLTGNTLLEYNYPESLKDQSVTLENVFTTKEGDKQWTNNYWNGLIDMGAGYNKVVGTGLTNGTSGSGTWQNAFCSFTVPNIIDKSYLKTFTITLKYLLYSPYTNHSLAWAISAKNADGDYIKSEWGNYNWYDFPNNLIGGTFTLGDKQNLETKKISIDLDKKNNKNILHYFANGSKLYLYLWENSTPNDSQDLSKNTNIHLCNSDGKKTSTVITFSFSKYLK